MVAGFCKTNVVRTAPKVELGVGLCFLLFAIDLHIRPGWVCGDKKQAAPIDRSLAAHAIAVSLVEQHRAGDGDSKTNQGISDTERDAVSTFFFGIEKIHTLGIV